MYELLQQLQQLGGDFSGAGWVDLYNLSGSQVSSSMQDLYGDTEGDPWQPELFQSLTPEMLRASEYKTYSPMIQQEGKGFLSKLTQKLGGQKGAAAAGGFAGSGGFQQYQSGARDVFGKDIANILGKTSEMRGTGRKGIQDLIAQWQQTAGQLSGQLTP